MSDPGSRWLFVVAREQVDLLTFMNRDGFLDPDASVVWDRRVEERRRSGVAGVPDRRVAERRQILVADHLRRYGFAVVDRERHHVIPPPAARVSGLGYSLPAAPPPPT